MTRLPSFGVLLGRLLDHRNVDVGALSQAAAVSESELQGVLDGAEPSPSLLRRLAVALNLHAADLFVMAGLAVPDDLAPLDPQANAWVARLVTCTVRLPAEQRRRVRQFVRSMPQQERPQPASPASADQWPPPGFGGMLMRMLFNRNLRMRKAGVIWHLTGMPLSESTVHAVGHRNEVSLEMLIGFATVLGIPAVELAVLNGVKLAGLDGAHLAALEGIEPPGSSLHVNPAADDIAELIWDVRRLTADQVRQVCEQAESMRNE